MVVVIVAQENKAEALVGCIRDTAKGSKAMHDIHKRQTAIAETFDNGLE